MIRINDKYYIDADSKNYTLKEKTTVTSKDGTESEVFKELGYYTTIESLFNGLLKTELREFISESDSANIEALLKKLKELEKFIKDKMKEV